MRRCQEKRRKKGAQNPKARSEVRYQGIKPHGKYWQVVHITPLNRVFRVVVKEQEAAAAIHDRLAIMREGLRAQTNFNYDRKQLSYILQDILVDRDANLDSSRFQVTITSEAEST